MCKIIKYGAISSFLSLVLASISFGSTDDCMMVKRPLETRQFYRIIKVNKGTQFLKAGEKLAGYLNDNSVCGAEGGGIGAEACAVVTAKVPAGFKEGVKIPGTMTFYYLKRAYVTGTPASNLVGFIAPTEKGVGIGGDRAIGVYRANN